MRITDASPALLRLFRELIDGVKEQRTGFMLNTGDIGFQRPSIKSPKPPTRSRIEPSSLRQPLLCGAAE